MSVTTFEGVVENGQVRLKANVRLPDNTKVYVVIPDFESKKIAHIFSPRLAHAEQAADFNKEVIEELPSANV